MDIEEQRDAIQLASDKLSDAIKQVIGKDARVGVFYIYLDNNEWVSGDSGNMNWIERIGALKYISSLEALGEDDKLKLALKLKELLDSGEVETGFIKYMAEINK